MEIVLKIAEKLIEHGKMLSTAESCTGGLLGHLLTDVPGSSNWYVGGAVTYSNELKYGLLGVQQQTLDRHGAVSAEVAEQMALGARQAFETAFAISVTGIAGPGGGTEEKPVGLTYIGVASDESVIVRRFVWNGGREGNKQNSARAAFELLLELLQEDESRNAEAAGKESAAVEAIFELDGTVRPSSFIWKGHQMKVTDWGRQWRDDGVQHFLVMSVDSRVWELRFEEASLRWTIHPRTEPRYLA